MFVILFIPFFNTAYNTAYNELSSAGDDDERVKMNSDQKNFIEFYSVLLRCNLAIIKGKRKNAAVSTLQEANSDCKVFIFNAIPKLNGLPTLHTLCT